MNTPDKAVSIDEYIDQQRAEFRASHLNALRSLLPQLREKAAAAAAAGEGQLSKDAVVLERVIASEEAAQARDPLPDHLAEAEWQRPICSGRGHHSRLSPEIGFSDDAFIATRVLERNPALLPS